MSNKPLYIALAAGGTAGHVNPALALAEELRQRGHQVEFFGNPNKLESKLVPEANFNFVPLSMSGFDRSRPWTLISAGVKVLRARRALSKHFSQARPDVAVGFGAYVEVPLIQWCSAHGIPCAIHEQNSVAGLANRMMAKRCKKVCLAFPEAQKSFAGANVVVTGNPVRPSILAGDRSKGRAALSIPNDAFMLLVFGGSLGAQHINETLAALKERLLAYDKLYVVHSSGKGGYDDTKELLKLSTEEQKRWQLLDYIDNMGDVLAAADLVVSRAGASSIAEIAATATPAILVPYPYATADHQTTNAHLLVDAGAARLVGDAELDSEEHFAQALFELIEQPKKLAKMREAAKGLKQELAASRLADEIEQLPSHT